MFTDVNFMITRSDKIGLIGRNGAGKSSLLKLLHGDMRPSSGSIEKERGVKTGVLSQHLPDHWQVNIVQEVQVAHEELNTLLKDEFEFQKELERRTDYHSKDYENLLIKVSENQTRLGYLNPQAILERIIMVLRGLGFSHEDLDRSPAEFSGGWIMRIELAKLLSQDFDLIMLDEPTNHLDIESIEWFENYIRKYAGAVLIISHDQSLLTNTSNRIFEVVNGKFYDFTGGYQEYVTQKAERVGRQERERVNQEKQIKQTEQLIDRFRYKASKAAFAQSLIKRLDKVELVEVDETDNSSVHLKFPSAPPSGKVAFELEDVKAGYKDEMILKGISLLIERGDKIAITGANGKGKSTILKTIVGDLKHSGRITVGHNVKWGYYAQNQDEILSKKGTVLEFAERTANQETFTSARKILGAFMFSGEDVQKKVTVLSGGEKARLALCSFFLDPVNTLILDEPTNHLDMATKDVLREALIQFPGTVIVVSHDRSFLDGLAKRIYYMNDGKLKEHLGTIYDLSKEWAIPEGDAKSKQGNKKDNREAQADDNGYELRRQLKGVEQRVKKMETILKDLEKQSPPMDDYEALGRWDKQVREARQNLESEYEKLFEIQFKLETI